MLSRISPSTRRPRRAVLSATLALVGTIALTGGFHALEAQETTIKIAVVDLERVVATSAAGQELGARLEQFQQQVQGEVDVLRNEAQAIRQRVAEGGDSLTEEKLAELQKEFEDKTIAIRRFRDDKQREGQKIQAEGLREIEKLLEPVFQKIRDEQGYDLIINNVPGVVVMANERVDITPQVIAALNAPAGG
jgi:outer membrane protein